MQPNVDYTYNLDIQLNPNGTEVFTSSKRGIKAFRRNVNGISFSEITMTNYDKSLTIIVNMLCVL